MSVNEIVSTIDQEIALLKQARALLVGGAAPAAKMPVSRPKNPVSVAVAEPTVKPAKKKKRHLTAEGRQRIAEAVKKRWAAQKSKAK